MTTETFTSFSFHLNLQLHDQVNLFREELDKKDRLIQHLVSLDGAPKVPRAPDSYRVKFEPSVILKKFFIHFKAHHIFYIQLKELDH